MRDEKKKVRSKKGEVMKQLAVSSFVFAFALALLHPSSFVLTPHCQ
jgi:hypothetical protein